MQRLVEVPSDCQHHQKEEDGLRTVPACEAEGGVAAGKE